MKLRITRSKAQVVECCEPELKSAYHKTARHEFPPASDIRNIFVRSKNGCMLPFVLNDNSDECFERGDHGTVITTCGDKISGVALRKDPHTIRTKRGIVCARSCSWLAEGKHKQLIFDVGTDNCGRLCGYDISYNDGSISWKPSMCMMISCGCATINIGATIYNKSGVEYHEASIDLVDTSSEDCFVTENKCYPMVSPLSLKRGTTLFSCIESMTVPEITKYYSVDIGSSGHGKVKYGYEFVAPAYIPRGSFTTYSVDSCDNLVYESQCHVETIEPCQLGKILIAGSRMVSVDISVTKRTVGTDISSVNGTVNIQNKCGHTTYIELKYPKCGMSIRSVVPKPTFEDTKHLIWKIPLDNTADIQRVEFNIN